MIHLININRLRIPSLALATLKVLVGRTCTEQVGLLDVESHQDEKFNRFARDVGDQDIVGFTCVSYNIKDVLVCCRTLRQTKPSCRIVLGGPIVSSVRYSQHLLKTYKGIDFIVRGRADDTFPSLLEWLAESEHESSPPAGEIPNMTFWDGDKPLATKAIRQANTDFSSLSPWLAEPDYLLGDYKRHARAALPYSTGYGCPNKCTYCIEATQQTAIYSMDRIRAELDLILSYQPQEIFWYDSTFGYSKRRGVSLMEFIADRNHGTQISVYVNIDHIDAEYCRLAKAANITFHGVGIQTIDRRTCSTISRPDQNTGKIRRTINSDLFQDHAKVGIGLIYGLPGEGIAEFKKTLNFALSLRSNDKLGIYRYCYYPGTRLYEMSREYVSKSDTDPEIVRSESMTEDDIRYCNLLASFYYIISRCFPFTLAVFTYLEGWDRVAIIERFAMKVKGVAPSKQWEPTTDVAFANKEDESIAALTPLLEQIVSEVALYSRVLAESIAEAVSCPAADVNRMGRWLVLDLRWRSAITRRMRNRIERDGRLEEFVAGLTGSGGRHRKNRFWFFAGICCRRSRFLQEALLLTGQLCKTAWESIATTKLARRIVEALR